MTFRLLIRESKWYNGVMKKSFFRLLAFMAAVPCSVAFAETDGWEIPEDDFYIGAAGVMTLAQGGGDVRRQAGAAARFGRYLSDFWALEGEAALCERTAFFSAAALWHWWGYERFDPFFRFGAKTAVGRDDDVGPMAGAGAFYHLAENFSLRFDADATLGMNRGGDMFYGFGVGVQWSF